jgi:outer membrane protein, adhesin transport system
MRQIPSGIARVAWLGAWRLCAMAFAMAPGMTLLLSSTALARAESGPMFHPAPPDIPAETTAGPLVLRHSQQAGLPDPASEPARKPEPELPEFIKAMARMGKAPAAPRISEVQAEKPQKVTAAAPGAYAPILTASPLPAFEPVEDEPMMRVAVTIAPVMRGTLPVVALPDVTTTASLAAPAMPGKALPPEPLADNKSDASLMRNRPRKPRAVTSPNGFRLADAVASAVMTYPEIRINEARVREAKAGIRISEAGLYPAASLRLASGGNFSGNYEGKAVPYTTASNAVDRRFDGGLVLRQLVYDFGATRSDIQRAEYLRDAEKQKLREKVDEIAYKTSQSFLKVLEQRSLLDLIDDTIRSHEQLSKVIAAQAKEGHGTLADVNRVNSRLVDVRAIRSDISLQLMSAEDQFQRLTRNKPVTLADVPDFAKTLPANPNAAISQALGNNPRLGAIHAQGRSVEKELEYQKASNLPKFMLELDSEAKNYRNPALGRTQVEGRAMLAMSYKLTDGGLDTATREQLGARIVGNEMAYLNEREQMEADIRQAFRAIESAGRKSRLVAEGVNSADRVRELYFEQFKGGKRTLFELLDGEMSYYTARRSQVESQFEGRRAMFDILRATGDLTVVLSRKG